MRCGAVQLDKLLKAASSAADVDDDLAHRPNVDALGSDDDDDDDDGEGEGEGGAASSGASKTGLYRPPKLAAVQYDEKKSAKAERDEVRTVVQCGGACCMHSPKLSGRPCVCFCHERPRGRLMSTSGVMRYGFLLRCRVPLLSGGSQLECHHSVTPCLSGAAAQAHHELASCT